MKLIRKVCFDQMALRIYKSLEWRVSKTTHLTDSTQEQSKNRSQTSPCPSNPSVLGKKLIADLRIK